MRLKAGGKRNRGDQKLEESKVDLGKNSNKEDNDTQRKWSRRSKTVEILNLSNLDYPMSIMLDAYSRWNDRLLLWLDALHSCKYIRI